MILIGLQRFPPQKTFAIKHRSFESETENRLSRREMLSMILRNLLAVLNALNRLTIDLDNTNVKVHSNSRICRKTIDEISFRKLSNQGGFPDRTVSD